ncbi:MAG: exopolysaccharide biosynthesis protein [Thermoleophilaceae bacterium]|nr:exopolysaccharide biosynthesis protein [Thermoleophilaceae bacterium]
MDASRRCRPGAVATRDAESSRSRFKPHPPTVGATGATLDVTADDAGRPDGVRSLEIPTEHVSDQLERWFRGEPPRTLGSLIELFGGKSFAVVLIVLMAVPALPLPTGGATHVLEVVAMLLALELVIGRRVIWLPARWERLQLAGPAGQRFARALLREIRWFERISRPRLRPLLRRRLSGTVFGAVVFALSLTAFLAHHSPDSTPCRPSGW